MTPVELQRRLQDARKMAGMSTRQAERFSQGRLDAAAIEALEEGRIAPSAEVLAILSETYAVRMEWLEGRDAPEPQTLGINARSLAALNANDVNVVLQYLNARQRS